jgi:hypothetical protein
MEPIDPNRYLSFALNSPSYVLPVSIENKQGKYLTWGADNLYPQQLWKMYTGSALHGAIIDRKKYEIVANGLYSISNNPDLTAFINKNCNKKGERFNDIFDKIVLDYLIYGGFALQIIYTKVGGKIAEIYYVDYSRLRYNNDADKIKYAKDWDRYRVKTIEYDLYDKSQPNGNRIFIYSGTKTRDWYAIPEYIAALPYIKAQAEIANYNLQNIINGMAPSMLITLKNGIPTIEQQADLERAWNEKFTGSSNAGKIVLSFSDTDTPSAEITPIEQNNANERYLNLESTTISNIFTGHQIPVPSLFGLQQSGKLGIATEYTQGLGIFQNVYVKPRQRQLVGIINRLLEVNFPATEKYPVCDLDFMPLEPIGMYFDDQVLMASLMTEPELRTKLKEQGMISTIEIPAGEKTLQQSGPLTQVDISDKELQSPAKPLDNGAANQ